ncbi:mannose-P-dolichol utilization defect 1 protein-like [Syngnathus typhle]|uniref:mannose-P-dolichol utilization defect 1 protein-like n=1 Tax=Syngnathus typhle TaxID=161592 RepID=UPI002A6B3E2B|nr:mannose-P-dolichol utilization defect 1 protein-like [Syngnathus typhle]
MAEVNLLHSGTSLPDPFEGLLLEYLLPPSCSDAFFRRFKFTDGPCLKILLSKCLGTVIILGSMFVKLPQIVKVIGAKNAEGVSFLSVLGELLAITGSLAYSVAYSFPFSAWGEALFVMLQTVVIGFLIQYYSGRTGRGVLFALLYLGVLSFLLTPLAPATVLTAMQASNMPAIIVSRVIQAATNFRNGHTGQLSALTVIILFAGSLARIFTSVQETGDTLLVVTYVVSVACNGLVVAQVLYYWKSTERFLQNQREQIHPVDSMQRFAGPYSTQHYSEDWEVRKAVQMISLVDSAVLQATEVTDAILQLLQGLQGGMDKYFRDNKNLKRAFKKEVVARIKEAANVLNDGVVELNAIRQELQKAIGNF